MKLDWIDQGGSSVACPACCGKSEKRAILATRSAVNHHDELQLLHCGECLSAFFPYCVLPEYEQTVGGSSALAFYLEQGAGIDVMVETLAMINPQRTQRYMEIGCGFGFSLDFARHSYGWSVTGIDPGSNARAGRDLLGLDIRGDYLRSGADVGPDKPDLILCSEVIEHIAEPDGFVAILRDALAPGGMLLLTTPNAAAIKPDTAPGVLIPLLSPGYHLVLFSRSGLEATLKRAGFETVNVVERGATLVAVAVAGGPEAEFDTDRRLDRSLYRSWLAARMDSVAPDHSLSFGLRYRLFKERVNSGDYAAARPLADQLAAACRDKWSFDLQGPDLLSPDLSVPDSLGAYQALYPFCLCGILYHLAVLAVRHDQDRGRARSLFLAAARYGELLRAVLQNEGMDDGEADNLSWKGRANAIWLLAWSDPAAAADAALAFASTPSPLLQELPTPSMVQETLQTILATLVNLGHYTDAERVAAVLSPVPAGVGEDSATLDDAETDFVQGILDLNHRADYPAGADRFARAHRICSRQPAGNPVLLWQSLYHEALGSLLGADGNRAAAALGRLLDPEPDPSMPPIPADLRERARALVRTHELTV